MFTILTFEKRKSNVSDNQTAEIAHIKCCLFMILRNIKCLYSNSDDDINNINDLIDK